MQTIPKDQIEATLGKGSFWFPKHIVGLEYLYGITALDAIREAKPSAMTDPVNLKLLPNGLEISIMHKFKYHTVGLALTDIKKIELELPEEIITKTKQERSIIGRAVLGGLLLGPIGAIVGGMTGLKDGEKTNKLESGKSLLTVQVEQNGKESFFVAAVPKNRRDLAKAFLQKNLSQFMS